MCHRDEGPMGIIECPDCGGEGQIFMGMAGGGRWDIDPPYETYRPCPYCHSTGGVEGLPELVDEYDLDDMTPPVAAYDRIDPTEYERAA